MHGNDTGGGTHQLETLLHLFEDVHKRRADPLGSPATDRSKELDTVNYYLLTPIAM